jgi:hypothetical protein
MQTLNENELRQTKGGNVIVRIIVDWGVRTYTKWKTYKFANQSIADRQKEDQ